MSHDDIQTKTLTLASHSTGLALDMLYLPSFDQVGDDTVISFADPATMVEGSDVVREDVMSDPSLVDALILI